MNTEKSTWYTELLNEHADLTNELRLTDMQADKIKEFALLVARNQYLEGNRDGIRWANQYFKDNPQVTETLSCHVCGVEITIEELDENSAYTYPDNKPHCPDHYPDDDNQ